MITARDSELIVADLSPSSTVLVNYTLPGRAPVLINSQEDLMVCPDRGGLNLIVRRREGKKYVESQVLARHDMIVNSLVIRGDLLLSAGWDCRAVVWVGLSLLSRMEISYWSRSIQTLSTDSLGSWCCYASSKFFLCMSTYHSVCR